MCSSLFRDRKGRFATECALAAVVVVLVSAAGSSLAYSMDEDLSNMEFAMSSAEEGAEQRAESTLLENSNVTGLETSFGGVRVLESCGSVIDCACTEDDECPLDPEGLQEDSHEEPGLMTEERWPNTTIGVFAAVELSPLALGAIAVDPVEVYAASAAHAFDESTDEFSLEETDSVQGADPLEIEGGYDGLYDLSPVPVSSANEGDEAISR